VCVCVCVCVCVFVCVCVCVCHFVCVCVCIDVVFPSLWLQYRAERGVEVVEVGGRERERARERGGEKKS